MIARWWLQFDAIVWPDKLAMDLAAFLPKSGKPRQVRRSEEQSQLPSLQIRRQIVRLANLSVVLMLRRLSSGVAKRFPTYQHLVQVALIIITWSTWPTYQHLVQVALSCSRCLLRHLRATCRLGFSLERSWLDWIRCRR